VIPSDVLQENGFVGLAYDVEGAGLEENVDVDQIEQDVEPVHADHPLGGKVDICVVDAQFDHALGQTRLIFPAGNFGRLEPNPQLPVGGLDQGRNDDAQHAKVGARAHCGRLAANPARNERPVAKAFERESAIKVKLFHFQVEVN